MLQSDHLSGESADASKIPKWRLPKPEVLHSAHLLKGAKEVLIAHGDEVYRLRVTRAGKLILQK